MCGLEKPLKYRKLTRKSSPDNNAKRKSLSNILNNCISWVKITGSAMLAILFFLKNRYFLKVYNKHLDLKFKLTRPILTGQNIVKINKTLNFEQYW